MDYIEKGKVLEELKKIDFESELNRRPKSNNEAEKLRSQGNIYFASRFWFKSLIMYNKSICFAEANSEALGIAYGNRSAVYFEWRKYDLCLNNIELAATNGFPQRLMNKLNDRKIACEVALELLADLTDDDKNDVAFAPVLSFQPHPVVPFIADCLKLRKNNTFGRFIVTKVDLSAGQVVAIEDSFCAILDPEFIHQRCTNCLREHQLNLIPCKRCTRAMFCCQNCAAEADQNFHRIECPIIDFISMYVAKDNFIHKAIRTTIRAIFSFQDFNSLRSFVEDKSMHRINVFDLNYQSNTPLSERYKAIHGLLTKKKKRTDAELFDCARISLVICNKLISNTSLSQLVKTYADKNFLKELIFCHIQLFPINAIYYDRLNGILPNSSKDYSYYGHGLFAFHGLINHSCEPNCFTICFNQRSTLFISRPIMAGEQLFISYGMDHVTKSVVERQELLFSQYKFVCQCKACTNSDYYDDMAKKSEDDVPFMLTPFDLSLIVGIPSKAYILNNLPRYTNYINKFDHRYPCLQLCATYSCLLLYLHILYGETSVEKLLI